MPGYKKTKPTAMNKGGMVKSTGKIKTGIKKCGHGKKSSS